MEENKNLPEIIDESSKELVEENKFKTFYNNLSEDFNLIRDSLVDSLKTNAEVQGTLKVKIEELCKYHQDDSKVKQMNYFLRSYNDLVNNNMLIGTAIMELYTGVSKIAEKELPVSKNNYKEIEQKTEVTAAYVTTTNSIKTKIANFNKQHELDEENNK